MDSFSAAISFFANLLNHSDDFPSQGFGVSLGLAAQRWNDEPTIAGGPLNPVNDCRMAETHIPGDPSDAPAAPD